MRYSRPVVVGSALVLAVLASVPFARAESELDKLFAAPLGANDAAYMFLAFSGVIVRTAAGTVLIDPANLLTGDDIAVLGKHKIDALLYTHSHGDHYDAAVARDIVRATGAVIIADPSLAAAIRASRTIPVDKVLSATSGRTFAAGGAKVRGVAGRHVGPITLFHVKLGEIAIFHGGDSAYVPVSECPSRLAFLPAGAPSPTASPADALKMARDVKPKAIVLIHGQEGQYEEFKALAAKELPGVAVDVGEPFKAKVVHLD
jgi:L-ascorbate metabolism protein UlaG (beta-lactamase superfamily)